MKEKILFFLCFFGLIMGKSAAQGVLSFTAESHDFGNVTEGTQATHEFEFTNTGNAPVIISSVNASCGCTTPYWTKEPIAPGKKGKVTASYNSTGRPGMFNKTITVVSNAQPATKVLSIKGAVVPKSELTVAPTPEQLAGSSVITIDKLQHSFGKIEKGQTVRQSFTVRNSGKSELLLERVQSPCNCVTYQLSQSAIAPGEQATLELRYTPRFVTEAPEKVTIVSNDLKTPATQITLQAQVVESLASGNMLKEQKSNVPFK
jgi:hypothetical protein